MNVVILAGSTSDMSHVSAIEGSLKNICPNVVIKTFYASAHKSPELVLSILKAREDFKSLVYVTVAGRSNALSGMVAANTKHIVIACPPFETTADYMVDIHSTLRMPSGVPVLTVLSPSNCAQAIKRILRINDE